METILRFPPITRETRLSRKYFSQVLSNNSNETTGKRKIHVYEYGTILERNRDKNKEELRIKCDGNGILHVRGFWRVEVRVDER